MMTVGYGFGMLAVGFIAMGIAGTIMYLIVNAIEDRKIKREKQEREKIDGLN